ncbi:MAG: BrxA family protein [Natronomonas sp.]
MDLTMCGLLIEHAEQLAQLYAEHGNWNEVKEAWFDERLSNRSTRGSSQQIYRVLTGRFKNAPTALPNPSALPDVFEACRTTRDKAQILYFYLVEDDPLVRYVVHEYVARLGSEHREPLDFSNAALMAILSDLEYADGGSFDYAESTAERWCEGFRSIMRNLGALDGPHAAVGKPPSIADIPLLVAMDYSYECGDSEWLAAPRGLWYLLQPERRFQAFFDRAASTDLWEYFELYGEFDLQPVAEPYSWIGDGGLS